MNLNYLFPEKPNEFQRFIKDLSKHSLSQTYQSYEEIKGNLDLSLNWFFASDSASLKFSDKVSLNQLNFRNRGVT